MNAQTNHSDRLGICLITMCLILFAYQPNDQYELIVAANRDEFYQREAARAHFWETNEQVLAGIDLQAGGSWLGIDRSNRFAAVTNYREDPPEPLPPRSRGELVSDFLTQNCTASEYLTEIRTKKSEYRGFNLVLMDTTGCFYYNNRTDEVAELSPGYYGLSNQTLNCNWPKVSDGTNKLETLIAEKPDKELDAALLELLQHSGDDREFSNSFIQSPGYGTCVSTLVKIQPHEVAFTELASPPAGNPDGPRHFYWQC